MFVYGLCNIWHRPTLPPVTAVPLALAGLTSLFGMGRGGHRRYRHLKIWSYTLYVISSTSCDSRLIRYATYYVKRITYNSLNILTYQKKVFEKENNSILATTSSSLSAFILQ